MNKKALQIVDNVPIRNITKCARKVAVAKAKAKIDLVQQPLLKSLQVKRFLFLPNTRRSCDSFIFKIICLNFNFYGASDCQMIAGQKTWVKYGGQHQNGRSTPIKSSNH